MPGEHQILKEFVDQLEPKVLGQVVEVVFEKMKMAGEAGSLLKIEEEIREAVADAKKQWRAETERAVDRKGRSLLFSEAEMERISTNRQQSFSFDVTDLTDDQFFEKAEVEVVEALRSYAEHARNGNRLQRRLFVEDAERGFAFLDLCHKRFDVVLMNPPFGNSVSTTRDYLSQAYPTTSHDLCATMIDRCTIMLADNSMLGAITSRTALFLQTFQDWRDVVLSTMRFSTVADLGYGVLDAMVETAMYVIEKRRPTAHAITSFLTALTTTDKANHILSCCVEQSSIEWRAQVTFISIPGKPLAYWVPHTLLALFHAHPRFLVSSGEIRPGIQTSDDVRFLRLSWEVDPSSINTLAPTHDPTFDLHWWAPMAKGGEFSPWWDDVHLLVNWHKNGEEIKNFRDDKGKQLSRPQNIDWFFRGGLTYPYRTTSAFGLRCLPRGCAFNNGGWGVFPTGTLAYQDVLAIYNSRVARYFMEILLGQGDSSVAGSAARNHGAESVGGIPCPTSSLGCDVARYVDDLIQKWREVNVDETAAHYGGPRQQDGVMLEFDTLRSPHGGTGVNTGGE